MMKTSKMFVRIDQKLAILAGKMEYGTAVVEIPVAELTQEELAIVAALPVNSWGGEYHLDPYYGLGSAVVDPVVDASVESIRKVLRSRVRSLAEQAVQKKARIEAAVEKFESSTDEELCAAWTEYYSSPSPTWFNVPSEELSEICKDPRVAGRARAIAAMVTAKKSREVAARREAEEKAEAERLQKRVAGLAALKAWALDHGSERLRLMLELQVGDWESIAQREYQDDHAPDGYERGTRNGVAKKRPTLEELKELQHLQRLVEAAGGVLRSPTIDWVVAEPDYENDDEGRKYTVAEVQVCSPDGDCTWYAREL